jgi:hypothetical protein
MLQFISFFILLCLFSIWEFSVVLLRELLFELQKYIDEYKYLNISNNIISKNK